MDYKRIARQILSEVGGADNIQDATHCFTRLRLVLKSPAKANPSAIERLEGVIQVVEAGGQFQIVLGSKVTNIYEEFIQLVNLPEDSGSPNGSLGNTILQTISKIFTPLVPAIAASGLIKGLLSAALRLGWISGDNSTFVILNAASNIIFFYMPVFLAYTAADALKCNKVIAMVIGAFLCHPTIDALVQDISTVSTIFGLTVPKMAFTIGSSSKVFAYTESVIPIILAVIILSYLERFLKKYIPSMLQIIFVPGLSLLVMVPVALVVVGPVGIYVGYGIQWLYQGLYGFSPVLGGMIVGGLWGACVIFGAHRALLPIGLNDVALTGTNTLMCFAGAANFSQAGASLGVMLKTKSANLKQVSGAATISAFLVGITEPAIYGCNLRLKKPMICAMAAGAAGGAIMGIGNAVNTGFANNGILTIMSYYGEGTTLKQFMFYLIGITVSFLGAAVLTYLVGFEDDKDPEPAKHAPNPLSDPAHVEITAPVSGLVSDIRTVSDPVFASGTLGAGVAITPTNGAVVAPADCTVSMVFPTGHAIGLLLDNGMELLIHIGFDTVALEGKHFTQHVQNGQHVKKGTQLITFDAQAISSDGYDPTVAVVVANSDGYSQITPRFGMQAQADTVILTAQTKP